VIVRGAARAVTGVPVQLPGETPPSLLTVCVGQPRTYEWLGHDLVTSIRKEPLTGPVRVLATSLEGDRQADAAQHGGADKAVYAYAREDALWWSARLGTPPRPSQFGENLATTGLELGRCVIGETWRIGTAVLQVSEPRTPCWKLGLLMGDPRFPRRFAAAGRTGLLLRVLETGTLQAGNAVVVTHTPAHGVTVEMVNDIYYRRSSDLEPLHAAPELAAHWREWASHRTVWHLEDERTWGVQADA
jgi:MOSC domain-containing protein YiiM